MGLYGWEREEEGGEKVLLLLLLAAGCWLPLAWSLESLREPGACLAAWLPG